MPLGRTTGFRRWCSESSRAYHFRCEPRVVRIRSRGPDSASEAMAFLTKKHLSRRTVLRGMGVAVSLPFLDAMVPAFTALARAQARPRTRFGSIYIANGAIMEQWIPASVGAGFDFKPILQPIEPFKDQIVVVTNLTRSHPGSQVGDHAVSAAGFLTGVWPKRTEAEDVLANTSVDQIVAQQIGQETPFPSLEVATEDLSLIH